MKFIIESIPNEYHQMFLHFDVPVEELIQRLCDYQTHDEVNPYNPAIVITHKIGTPKESLTGVEIVKPLSRYCLFIAIGKAFKISDAIQKIIGHLEIIPNNDEWIAWMQDLHAEKRSVLIKQHSRLNNPEKNKEQTNKKKRKNENLYSSKEATPRRNNPKVRN